jgi:hypothetical protein
MHIAGNTKGGSIIVPLTSCLTGLELSVFQIKTKIDSCHTADSKPVKQEVNSTVILPPLVFPVHSKSKHSQHCMPWIILHGLNIS